MGLIDNAFAKARALADSFQNIVTGLNTDASKAAGNTYVFTPATPAEIEAAYRSGWFRKIVDIPAEDMTREWREWQAEDEQIELIEAEEKRLDLIRKVRTAIALGRLQGGGALILGMAGTPDPKTPLKIETVKQGGLEYVHVMGREEFLPSNGDDVERDPTSPFFGRPKFYKFPLAAGGETEIHPSRVIPFLGQYVPRNRTALRDDEVWGDSLFQSVKDAIMNADLTASGIAELVQEAKIDVYKIEGFMGQVAVEGYETLIKRRFALVQQLKSISNAIVLDLQDEYEQKTLSFDGLPDILKLQLMMMSGVADIPATRLLGKSPDGQNSTGESDLRNYYDSLASKQNTDLSATLTPLDEVLIRSALGSRPEEIHYRWSSLWQPTAAEQSEIDKRDAETDKIYADVGIAPPTAMAKMVTNRLIEKGTYPGIEEALDEAEAEGKVPPITEQLSPAEELEAEAKARAANQRPGSAAPARKPALRVVGKDGVTVTITDATPRTLYVRRDVVNSEEILKWARGQGFEDLLAASDLHVTIIYSKEPVDWLKMGESWTGDDRGRLTIKPGGPRVVEPLGDATAVLQFVSTELQWRQRSMIDAGAQSDYPDYIPHITLSYGPTPDLAKVVPYRGKIVLGPEIFEEIDPEKAAARFDA